MTSTSLTDTIAGDSVSLTIPNAFFAGGPNVGTSEVLPTLSPSLTGSDSHNYELDYWLAPMATITPATAYIVVAPYFIPGPGYTLPVTFDGKAHMAADTVSGVNGALPSSDVDLTGTIHTNAGTYIDTWTFSDPSGNYLQQSGTLTDVINKANANVTAIGYNTFYNAMSHTAIGAVIGVNGTVIAGLDLSGTTHTAVGTYADIWTFSNPNYNTISGVVGDTITPSKSKMVRETVLVPKTTVVKVTELVTVVKEVKVVERDWVGNKWVKKTVLVPETVLVRKTVLVNETKMTKKTEMVKVYYS